MGLIEVFAVAISVGFGYLFFRFIKPKTDSGNIPLDYAQLFFCLESLYINFSHHASIPNNSGRSSFIYVVVENTTFWLNSFDCWFCLWKVYK